MQRWRTGHGTAAVAGRAAVADRAGQGRAGQYNVAEYLLISYFLELYVVYFKESQGKQAIARCG